MAKWVLSASLLSVGGLLAWLLQHGEPERLRANLPQHHGEPAILVEQVRLRHYTDTGQLQAYLTAHQATHYPAEDILHLEAPEGHYWPAKAASQGWQLNAQQGKWQISSSLLYLSEQVRLLPPGLPPMQSKLYTERLWIDPQQERSWTPDPVRFTHAGGSIEALGLEVNLAAGTLHLLHQVQGQYLAPQ